MEEEEDNGGCPLCTDVPVVEKRVVLTSRGKKGLQDAAKARGVPCPDTSASFHERCREKFTNKKAINSRKRQLEEDEPSSRRGCPERNVSSRIGCLLCSRPVQSRAIGVTASLVKTMSYAQSLLEACERRKDLWSMEVRGRVEYYAADLHAADAAYHHDCNVSFRTGREVPKAHSEPEKKRVKEESTVTVGVGRPTNVDQLSAMNEVCEFLRKEGRATISVLRERMDQYLREMNSTATTFSKKWMKQKLVEVFGDEVSFSSCLGQEDVAILDDSVHSILLRYANARKCAKDDAGHAKILIEAAARVIKSEISNIPSNEATYPSAQEIFSNDILSAHVPSLQLLLQNVMTEDQTKLKFIGQSIINMARPRLLTPMNFGLGISLYHIFRSRYLIDFLYSFGLSPSYNEILKFVRNAATSASEQPIGLISDEMKVLFSADNVDHNIVTLDGRGTFHGLGAMASVTPANTTHFTISRRQQAALDQHYRTIDTKDYRGLVHMRSTIQFGCIPNLTQSPDELDLMWELSTKFTINTPNWNGMMCQLHPGAGGSLKSAYHFLPMIDLPSTDMTCLYSALSFIADIAHKHGIPAIVTFDQPLFWKSAQIVNTVESNDAVKDIVLLLGGFHTFMNLIGAIGYIMGGLGIQELFELLYAENVVPHLLSGKAVSRAFRAHLLLDRAMMTEILADISENPKFRELLLELQDAYVKILEGSTSIIDIAGIDDISELKRLTVDYKAELSANSRTTNIWIRYHDMLQVARNLIRAERTGNWTLHLQAMKSALPIFAAAGHFNYLKSAYLYLEIVIDLADTRPDVYCMFSDGFFVSRRTNKFWAGISSDLAIEQILMKSLKSKGGLTRGSGMTETQRTLWTCAAPVLSEFTSVFYEMTGKSPSASEQHKELSRSRMSRDRTDQEKLRQYVASFEPFSAECVDSTLLPKQCLKNIITGVQAPESVNVDDYALVGAAVMNKMNGKDVFTHKFSRNDRAISMDAGLRSVKLETGSTIDTGLLFQRLLIAAQAGDISLNEALNFELSPYPLALFEGPTMPLKADKPALAKAITKLVKTEQPQTETETTASNKPITDAYILDGGSLIHRLPWKVGSRYLDIASSYAAYVLKNRYPRPSVVFDGYPTGPTIKDSTHQRRSQTSRSENIVDMRASLFLGKKERVLASAKNKDSFVKMVAQQIRMNACCAFQSTSDADRDIAMTTIESARHVSTTLLGEDTDLLVLVLSHYEPDMKDIYIRSDKKNSGHLFDIRKIHAGLGHALCRALLFIHAYSGCDSTSRIAGISKAAVLTKVRESTALQGIAKEFSCSGQTVEMIEELGREAMKILFGQDTSKSMAEIRSRILQVKIAKANSFVKPERLPPTDSATNYHSRRVYFQIMDWLGLSDTLNPLDWGWTIHQNRYVPVPMGEDPAPARLLSVVHCQCKTGCGSARCSCRKYGLPCHPGCGPCQDGVCDNIIQADLDDDSDED